MVFSYANFPTITFIAVDRVLVSSSSVPSSSSHRRVYIMIIISWIIPIINAMFPTNNKFSGFEYLNSTLHCSPRFDDSGFVIAFGTINYGIVIIALFVAYTIIIYRLWKTGKRIRCGYSGYPTSASSSGVSGLRTSRSGVAVASVDGHSHLTLEKHTEESCRGTYASLRMAHLSTLHQIPCEDSQAQICSSSKDKSKVRAAFASSSMLGREGQEEVDQNELKQKQGNEHPREPSERKEQNTKRSLFLQLLYLRQSPKTSGAKDFSTSEISSDTKSRGQHESSGIQTRKMKADKKKYRAEKRVALMGENQIFTVSAF